jgi:Ni/Co efflux regulator RcnB
VDYRRHHLRAPPRGYQWVRADNDYALVALTTGLIASIVAASN